MRYIKPILIMVFLVAPLVFVTGETGNAKAPASDLTTNEVMFLIQPMDRHQSLNNAILTGIKRMGYTVRTLSSPDESIEKNHGTHGAEIDRPIAALLSDLEQRGLLHETLVVWGGEFGRMPFSEGKDAPGRNHNPYGFSMWLAGGGVRGGTSYGETDEFGFEAVEKKIHLHDLHATILHIMGLDHELLTYFHQGREESLTDVGGRVIHDILA